jgi:hypothetical protein
MAVRSIHFTAMFGKYSVKSDMDIVVREKYDYILLQIEIYEAG